MDSSKGFILKMEKLGMHFGPDQFWFYRFRQDYLDIIAFWINSSKSFVTIPIICFKTDLIDHCDMEKFPRGFINGMSSLSSAFVNYNGISIGGDSWKIKAEEDVNISVKEIYKVIEEKGNPWLLNINDDKNLWDSIPMRIQQGNFGQALKEKLNLS